MTEPIKFTIELMQQTAGKTSRDTAKFLNIKAPTYTQYLNSNFQSLIRFIKIADFCGYKVKLINKDKNMKLNLTKLLKDAEDGTVTNLETEQSSILNNDSD